jgi:lipooligosaccharide transport system ATP-binding protein
LEIIRAHGLVKRFGELTAVDGVDLEIQAGECFGLLGPNGAGKTTVVKMLTATAPLTAGNVLVNGLDISARPEKVKAIIGVLPQIDNLDPDLTVMRNLLAFGRYFDIQRKEAQERAWESLELLGLMEKHSARIETLSGGMRRRLLIARALINQPMVLILDEPTVGLDPQTRHLVWQKLLGLKERGVTELLTTQNMEEAARLCDRLAIMHLGRIVAQGSPKQIISRYGGKQILESRPVPEDRERVLSELRSRQMYWQELEETLYIFQADGQELDDKFREELGIVRQRSPNLEDVFLRLTGRALQD